MKSQTMLEDQRWLLKYFASKNPVVGLVFTIPLLIGFFYFGFNSALSISQTILQIFIGVIYWSYVEYAAHRHFYHWTPKNKFLRYFVESFHVYHHRHIEDMEVLNAGPALAMSFALVMGVPVFLITQSLSDTSMILFGSTLAYYIYEWVHYYLHQRTYKEGTVLGYLQRFHFFHHEKNWNVNFGVTNPIWDIIFRTYKMPQEMKLKLVTRESLK